MPKTNLIRPQFTALLAFQDHVVHRDQVLAHGLTPRMITHRLQTGEWRRSLPQI
jgi:hypothetical protein